jgi:hypothetical protein
LYLGIADAARAELDEGIDVVVARQRPVLLAGEVPFMRVGAGVLAGRGGGVLLVDGRCAVEALEPDHDVVEQPGDSFLAAPREGGGMAGGGQVEDVVVYIIVGQQVLVV